MVDLTKKSHDEKNLSRHGRASCVGQKIKRGIFKKLFAKVENLVAVVEYLDAVVKKLVAVFKKIVAVVEKFVAVVRSFVAAWSKG